MPERLCFTNYSCYVDARKLGDYLPDAYFAKQFVFDAQSRGADVNAESGEHLGKRCWKNRAAELHSTRKEQYSTVGTGTALTACVCRQSRSN